MSYIVDIKNTVRTFEGKKVEYIPNNVKILRRGCSDTLWVLNTQGDLIGYYKNDKQIVAKELSLLDFVVSDGETGKPDVIFTLNCDHTLSVININNGKIEAIDMTIIGKGKIISTCDFKTQSLNIEFEIFECAGISCIDMRGNVHLIAAMADGRILQNKVYTGGDAKQFLSKPHTATYKESADAFFILTTNNTFSAGYYYPPSEEDISEGDYGLVQYIGEVENIEAFTIIDDEKFGDLWLLDTDGYLYCDRIVLKLENLSYDGPHYIEKIWPLNVANKIVTLPQAGEKIAAFIDNDNNVWHFNNNNPRPIKYEISAVSFSNSPCQQEKRFYSSKRAD